MLLQEHLRDMRTWANEGTRLAHMAAVAVRNRKHFSSTHSEVADKISILIDQGRYLLPNHPVPYGQHKLPANQGLAQKPIDCLKEIHIKLIPKGGPQGPYPVELAGDLIDLKRRFVDAASEVVEARFLEGLQQQLKRELNADAPPRDTPPAGGERTAG